MNVTAFQAACNKQVMPLSSLQGSRCSNSSNEVNGARIERTSGRDDVLNAETRNDLRDHFDDDDDDATNDTNDVATSMTK